MFGVYMSPFVRDLALAAVVFAPVKLALDRCRIERFVWHRALFDVALFACIVAVVTFALGRAGVR